MEDIQISSKDKKLLEAVLSCGRERLTIDAIAVRAGLKPDYVCDRLRDPVFRTMFAEAAQSSLIGETPSILYEFAQQAKAGSFKHGKLILEITGLHQEKQRVELDAKVEVDTDLFTKEERQTLIKTITSKYE